jgi:hypothetical protein
VADPEGTEPAHDDRWRSVSRGVFSVEAGTGDTPRDVVFRVELSDGHTEEVHFQVPALIWCGTYDPSREYETGDAVAWNGASWFCCASFSQNVPPGEGPAWALMAKQGRPGQRGEKGDQGERGERGADGRDGNGIKSVTLEGTVLLFELTDGSVQHVEIQV